MRKRFATPGVGCVSAWPSRARNRSFREEPMSGGLNLLTYPSASIDPEKLIPRQARPYLDEKRFPRLTHVTEAQLAGLRKLKGPAPKARKSPGILDARV